MGRTAYLTWCGSFFVDGKRAWNRLGILFERSPFLRQALIILTGQGNWTNLFALPAAGALVQIDITGLLPGVCDKVPRFAVERNQFGVGKKLYI